MTIDETLDRLKAVCHHAQNVSCQYEEVMKQMTPEMKGWIATDAPGYLIDLIDELVYLTTELKGLEVD